MIGEISFCDQVGFNIKTDETKRFILERIQNKYGLKIITKHFEKYDDRMFESIQKRPHMISVRSNGNPYFMYMTRLNFVNYCIFIDKKIQQGYSYPRMILSHFKFDNCLFEDTIIDGEMVKTNDGTWTYLLNDLVVLKGQHLTDYNLIRRLNLLYETIEKYFKPDVNDICKILIKKYFKCDEGMVIMNDHINKVNYSCRGLYFKPLFLKFKDILINFDDNLITKVERTKYKHLKSFMLKEDGEKLMDVETSSVSSERSTKSNKSLMSDKSSDSHASYKQAAINPVHEQSGVRHLNTRKTNLPDVYDVLDENMQLLGTAAVPSLTISKYLRETFSHKNIVDIVNIPFKFSTNFNKWIPVV